MSCVRANGGDLGPCCQLEVCSAALYRLLPKHSSVYAADAHSRCQADGKRKRPTVISTVAAPFGLVFRTRGRKRSFPHRHYSQRDVGNVDKNASVHVYIRSIFQASTMRVPNRVLQNRLLELYSELAAPQQAAAYQQCYTAALSNERREITDDCAKEVAAMKRALKRLKLYPFADR